MKQNVGGRDRQVRFALGTLLVIVGAAGYAGFLRVAFGPFPQALTSIILTLIGVVLLATAATRKCLCNRLLGIDTRGR